MHRKIRPPAVAGLFYPGDAGELARTVRVLLDAVIPPAGPRAAGAWHALIVPHAGYPYSGPVAASAYRMLAGRGGEIRRVVLLGPAHRVYLQGVALPSVDAFVTPLGEIPLDRESLDVLARVPGVAVSDTAHAMEHSLEVQLPFLQSVLGVFTLVPLVVGDCPADLVAGLLARFADDPHTLIVVSSDLSHFLDYEAACATDQATSQAIVARTGNLGPEQACGARAVNGLLLLARQRGWQVTELDLRNSGDTAGGRAEVVGYGAYAVT